MHYLIPLPMLRPGQRASIGELIGQADDVQRLQELGMRIGCTIEMVQAGSPCIVNLEGTKLCFRACDATSVLVRLGAVA